MTALLICSLLTSLLTQASDPTINEIAAEAKFLNRVDLPGDFRFPLLELDFAVLRVRLENNSSETWSFKDEELEIRDPGGKLLQKALLTEIVPKILKSDVYKRSNRAVHGQVGNRYPAGHPGIYGNPYAYGGARLGSPSGAKVVSATQAQEIRDVLEEHQVRSKTLAPGEILEGLVYLRSKKSASQLTGGVLRLGKAKSVTLD